MTAVQCNSFTDIVSYMSNAFIMIICLGIYLCERLHHIWGTCIQGSTWFLDISVGEKGSSHHHAFKWLWEGNTRFNM